MTDITFSKIIEKHILSNLNKEWSKDIIISDKIDIKPKLLARDREGKIQENTPILNTYAPNIKVPILSKKHYSN